MSEAADTPDPEILLRLLRDQDRVHALLLLDADGRITAWLAGAENVFGYRAEEIVGRSVSELFTPEDRAQGLDAHELEVARRDGHAADDRWHLRKDGTRIWVIGVLVPLREAGHLVGFAKILRDRTEMKQQLVELRNRIATLEKADERKNLFLGTLAHELRNPLAPLTNAAQLVRLAAADREELLYPAQVIERQLDLLRRLVDDLLDVTRVGTGKVQLKKERLALNDVLTRVADQYRPEAERRRQQFDLLLPAGRIEVDGDADRLHQVFVNLLTNAIKYTPDGGHIWLQATAEGSQAVVAVRDTGVGIAPEALPRIFELFTQEEASRPRSEGGLGLGLPLVKSLVALHGGSVQVQSEGRGKGSMFAVRLPLAKG